jgi:major type 1 subunit fimbrin (pilin)
MKKTLLSAALMAGFGIAAFAPQPANAADGTMTFNGAVTGATCTINVGTAAGGLNPTITLPTVATTSLAAAGQTAGATAFSVYLTACPTSPALQKASVNFEAGANVNAAGRIINTGATGPATLVDLQLTDGGSNPIVIGTGPVPTTYATFASASATFPYFVRYYATGAATAGAVKGTVQYSIVYQ